MYLRQPCPVGRVARCLSLLLHQSLSLWPGSACTGQVKGASSPALIDGVQGAHEARPALQLFTAWVQAQLLGICRLQIHQHDAGLGMVVAGLVEVPLDGARQFGQVRAVAGEDGQFALRRQ